LEIRRNRKHATVWSSQYD